MLAVDEVVQCFLQKYVGNISKQYDFQLLGDELTPILSEEYKDKCETKCHCQVINDNVLIFEFHTDV